MNNQLCSHCDIYIDCPNIETLLHGENIHQHSVQSVNDERYRSLYRVLHASISTTSLPYILASWRASWLPLCCCILGCASSRLLLPFPSLLHASWHVPFRMAISSENLAQHWLKFAISASPVCPPNLAPGTQSMFILAMKSASMLDGSVCTLLHTLVGTTITIPFDNV